MEKRKIKATERELEFRKMSSPVGVLHLVANNESLVAICWENDELHVGSKWKKAKSNHSVLNKVEKQLGEYFAGARTEFDLPLEFGGTDFQKQTWNALLQVPFGETRSYSEQAIHLGDVKKIRAVASANGKNPISIIAPCHRIIGKDGSLTGFAGGLDKKKWLLEHEQKVLAEK